MLQDKCVVLGVTGGIAAYKAVELLRLLVKAGAEVHVVMTHSAQEFITPLTFQTLSGNRVNGPGGTGKGEVGRSGGEIPAGVPRAKG